jgi:uncharacterized protein YjbI with pentapeptide repeats
VRTRTVRDTQVALPGDDPAELEAVGQIPLSGDRVTDRVVTGGSWARATLSDTLISRCWLTGADLSASNFTGVTFDRCVLSGCTLMGAHWDDVTLRDVGFEDCRLDYATFTGLSTRGPAIFMRCSFTETTIADSRLNAGTFDQCRLDQLDFQRCDMHGADLRGNDMHPLATVTGLHGVRLDQDQLPGIAEVLVRELAITVADSR